MSLCPFCQRPVRLVNGEWLHSATGTTVCPKDGDTTAEKARDQAREEISAEVSRILMEQLGATAWRERDRADRIATMLLNPTRFDRLAGLLGYVKAENVVTVEQCRLVAREARADAWDKGYSFAGFEPQPDENPYRT